MASFVNGCVFTATSSGTGSFVVSAAVTGWQTPAQAGASNGATYRYRAYSADNTQWEIGSGVYTTGTVTLTRVLIEASSNGGSATNFTLPPVVALTMFDEDFVNRLAVTTDNTLPRFDGTTGEIQTSGIVVDDSNNVSGVGTLGTTGIVTIQNGQAVGSFVGGADVNASTLTNNTRKIFRATSKPYANASANLLLFAADNLNGTDSIAFGGYPGFSSGSVNEITFGTTPTQGTTGGTTRLTITRHGAVNVSGNFGRAAPVTKTADFTVADTENWLINNKSGSTCTVTLPAASSWTGREIMIKTIQAQTVVSASSNVVPLAGGAAGTAILSANAGRWCTLVSNGTNWEIMNGVI